MVTEVDHAFAMKNYDLEARTDGKGYIVTAQPGNHPMASDFQKIQWSNKLSYEKNNIYYILLEFFSICTWQRAVEPGVCE